jgi:Na+/phosphate symporter
MRKVCNLQAIELLYQHYYKMIEHKKKIEQNLKLLNEDLNIKRIHRKINDYLKLINKEASKIYKGMKEEVNYP